MKDFNGAPGNKQPNNQQPGNKQPSSLQAQAAKMYFDGTTILEHYTAQPGFQDRGFHNNIRNLG